MMMSVVDDLCGLLGQCVHAMRLDFPDAGKRQRSLIRIVEKELSQVDGKVKAANHNRYVELCRLRGLVEDFRNRGKLSAWYEANMSLPCACELLNWNKWSAAYDEKTKQMVEGE